MSLLFFMENRIRYWNSKRESNFHDWTTTFYRVRVVWRGQMKICDAKYGGKIILLPFSWLVWLGGRNVLGTRRVSIKWLWPVEIRWLLSISTTPSVHTCSCIYIFSISVSLLPIEILILHTWCSVLRTNFTSSLLGCVFKCSKSDLAHLIHVYTACICVCVFVCVKYV